MSARQKAGLILAILCVIYPALAQTDLKLLSKKLQPSLVAITCYDKENRVLARGTGFFTTRSGEILTRRRVFPAETQRAEVRTSNGKSYRVPRLPSDGNKADLVLISIDIPPDRVSPVVFTRKILQVNDPVVTFKLVGTEQQPVDASVSAIEESSSGKALRISATLSTGSDGAPVFDTTGELVGVADISNAEASSFVANTGESLNGLVPVISEEMAHIIKPKALNSPMPQYTEAARRNGVQGSVTIRVLIGEDGKVLQAKLIKGLPFGLDDEALKAAYRLKFKPAMSNGKPVKYWMPVLVEFKLGINRMIR